MPRYTETAKDKLLDRTAAMAMRRRGGTALADFIHRFYHRAAPEEVLTLDRKTLFGAASSIWKSLQSRRRGKVELRVFNPSAAKDGFESVHTIVEIICDDMPFLVDSLTGDLTRTNTTVHLVVHPVLHLLRDQRGTLQQIFSAEDAPPEAATEALIQIYVDHHSSADEIAALGNRLRAVLGDVRAAVEDWSKMRTKVAETINEIGSCNAPVPEEERAEAIAFLRWLDDDHFTFIGYRDYRFVTNRDKTHLEIAPNSGLGILRKSSVMVYEGLLELPELPPEVAAFMRKPEVLMVGKANRRSTVQRVNQLDTVAVRRFDEEGRAVGGRLIAGLFGSPVFTSSPREIPMLRGKVTAILDASGFEPKSHDARGLLHILETLPRHELFQVDTQTLLETSVSILRLRERQRVALYVHPDPLGRWVSCLVYVPRDRFDTRLRHRLAAIVTAGFGGTLSAFQTSISDEPLARVQFIVKTVPGAPPPQTVQAIEDQLVDAARDWRDDLATQLIDQHGPERGRELLRSYGEGFPVAYRERYDAPEAVSDIEHIAAAIADGGIVFNLHRSVDAKPEDLRLKLYRRDQQQPLSDVLPVLENMGVRVIDEIPHRVVPSDSEHTVWIHDFGLSPNSRDVLDLNSVKGLFEEAMRGVCRGDTENDGFGTLVLRAGLSSRRIVILRAYCKFLLQAGIPFSQAYMETTLANHPKVTRAIVELFETLFDPTRSDEPEANVKRLTSRIRRALEQVASLDEDRILRRFTNAVTSTLRTNYFQKDADGNDKPYVALKLDSGALSDLPLPRPSVEVFIYSPRVDAVHLRGGKVARGGIRWSDRREDFRTEVLGLMKSQMTKNAVIVPVGAKGGFVVKQPPSEGGREAAQREAIECYKTMMRGLLDITDNLVDERVVPPADVVRRDGDDPYLVVAADKGTATFSDIANGVASDYGFWLADAFASGGSAGYDHKAMGITARGAWESIKRHFREVGVDAMATDFTCVGVGDMSGDVFGNGATYSRHMRLVAAFNHQHILVDPTPDAAASFRERKRLFALPRSSWSDYDRKLISRGGGIFDRSAKSIRVSSPMRKLFGLGKKTAVTPAELIRAILECEVDLLFFGGIGTYIRSSDESNAEVGDRGNDSLRVCGKNVRARIIGEGANLAITQRGRIEYALSGGRINTDFIDNSAGVDCSDHEVNIKIALQRAVAAGKLTQASRNKLLGRMTDDVAALVLRDNYRQSNALSEAQRQSVALLDDHVHFLATLEREERLNRGVEFLPSDEEIDERRAKKIGMARPELAVLLAYAKIVLKEQVLDSDLVEDPHLANGIGGYFPKAMRRTYADQLHAHPLRREITATYVANTIVNRAGPTFVTSVQERTGAPAAAIARSYMVCRQVYRAAELWADVDELDDTITAEVQTEMRLDILSLIEHGTRWFLCNEPQAGSIDDSVTRYAPAVKTLEKDLDRLLPTPSKRARNERASYYTSRGAPHTVARRIANLGILTSACDIARIAAETGVKTSSVARAHYQLGDRLSIDWLRVASTLLVNEGDRWRKAAALGLTDDLSVVHAELTAKLVAAAGADADTPSQLEDWLRSRGTAVNRLSTVVADLRCAPAIDLSMISVATADMRALALE